MQISEELGSGVEEKDAECVDSMPASSNTSEAPKIATHKQIYLNVPNVNYLGLDIQMQHVGIQVKCYPCVPYEEFSLLQSHRSQVA